MPILSKPTKKPFPFGKLSDRAKTMLLGHLDLGDLFFFSQCTKSCKELVIAEKVPADLTWNLWSNWQATISLKSKAYPKQFTIRVYASVPGRQEALDKSCKATMKGVNVLESNVCPGIFVVSTYEHDEWILATRGYSDKLIELFQIEKFAIGSSNHDPDALMHYLESVRKFQTLDIAYSKVGNPSTLSIKSGIQSARQEGAQPVWDLRSRLRNFWSRNPSRPGSSRGVNPDEQHNQQTQTFDRQKLEDLLFFVLGEVEVETTKVLNFSLIGR